MLQKDYLLRNNIRIILLVAIMILNIQHSYSQKMPLSDLSLSDSIKYISSNCGATVVYTRQYLNDSVFIDICDNIRDTMVIAKGKLSLFRMNTKYNIVDIQSDFSNREQLKFHTYYFQMAAKDTLKKTSESDWTHKARLSQYIIAYVPKDQIKIGNRNIYIYYIFDKCYPVNEQSIQSKIANRQYGLIYFEEGVGVVGRSGSHGSCGLYFIEDKSYTSIKAKLKNF